ncbi:MAG: SAM-dependent methyltransferase, partial [Bacteroidaceae bacterium]|nr:SAM-dependent methyltransferase [Bacteroidaceae bacterium]
MFIAQATLQFVKEHRNDDVKALLLQASRYPDVDMRSAVQQIEGWQHAVAKLPEWAATEGILYPPRLSMEQCSSEPTALYKASIMAGGSFADMTGGFGIDCSYISRNFLRGFFIERSEELCKIAAHNFSLLGLHHIEVLNGNSEEKLPTLPSLDWISIDPARRDIVGKKVVALSDCEP